MVMGLSSQKIQGRSYLFHENGKKLQNNKSESIRGFLRPLYSQQKSQRIETIPKKKTKPQDRHKFASTCSEIKQNYKKYIILTDIAKEKTIVLCYPPRKKIVIKNACNQEVIQ